MRKLSIFGLGLGLTLIAVTALAKEFHPTRLSGSQEVPPRDTKAHGMVLYWVSDDGTWLRYRVIVTNIENVFAAHIHIGAPGVNGPVALTLFSGSPGGGRTNGILAERTVTAADLSGPLAGRPLADLLTEMRNGNAYVNVHTDDGQPPADTGPGDFPGGEIRGQISD
jgi:hypothetical protein